MTKNSIKYSIFIAVLFVSIASMPTFVLARKYEQTASLQDAQSLADKAFSLYLEAKFDEADKLAEQSINLNPKIAVAEAVRGLILLEKREFDESKKQLIEARNIASDLDRKNRPPYEFLMTWADYLKNVNDDYKYIQSSGDYFVKEMGEPKTLFDLFSRSLVNLTLEKDDVSSKDLPSVIKNLPVSVKYLTKIIESNPKATVAYVYRGIGYYNLGQNDLALNDFNKAISIAPNYSFAYSSRGKLYLKNLKNDESTFADFNKAVEIDPKNIDGYVGRGDYYRNKKQSDSAIAEYTKAIELNPKSAMAYSNRGKVYLYDLKDFKRALGDFSKAAGSNRQNAWDRYHYGVSQLRTGNTGSAITDLKRAIEIEAHDEFYVALGEAYTVNKQFDKASEVLAKAKKTSPNNTNAYFFSALAHQNSNRPDEAIADYTKAIELDPKDADSLYNRGKLYFEDKQQFEKATADFTKVIELYPNDFWAYFRRADVYESMGNKSASSADRKKLEELKYTAEADPKRYFRSLYPNISFNSALAREMLAPGSATLAGKACASIDGYKFTPRNVKIFLYPATPYLEAWRKLREERENKEFRVYKSREADRYRLEAETNESGQFAFKNLKPGRYFLRIVFDFTYSGTDRIYTGSNTQMTATGLEKTNYYYDQDYTVDGTKRLEEFVEIKSEGEMKKITMKNAWFVRCS